MPLPPDQAAALKALMADANGEPDAKRHLVVDENTMGQINDPRALLEAARREGITGKLQGGIAVLDPYDEGQFEPVFNFGDLAKILGHSSRDGT